MKWDFQTIGFTASEELAEHTRSKVEGLTRFYDQMVGAEVYLKLDYNDKKQNKVAEIKLNIPGNDLYAENRSDNFEKSVNEATHKLESQIRKLKTKQSTH